MRDLLLLFELSDRIGVEPKGLRLLRVGECRRCRMWLKRVSWLGVRFDWPPREMSRVTSEHQVYATIVCETDSSDYLLRTIAPPTNASHADRPGDLRIGRSTRTTSRQDERDRSPSIITRRAGNRPHWGSAFQLSNEQQSSRRSRERRESAPDTAHPLKLSRSPWTGLMSVSHLRRRVSPPREAPTKERPQEHNNTKNTILGEARGLRSRSPGCFNLRKMGGGSG